MAPAPAAVTLLDPAPNALGAASPERRAHYAAHLGEVVGKVLHPVLAPLHDPETRAAALAGLADAFAAELVRAASHGRTRQAGEAATRAAAKLLIESLQARAGVEFARPLTCWAVEGER